MAEQGRVQLRSLQPISPDTALIGQCRVKLRSLQTIGTMYQSDLTSDDILEILSKSSKHLKIILNSDKLSDNDMSLLIHLIAKAAKCSMQTQRQAVLSLLNCFCNSKLLEMRGTRLLVGVTCSNYDIHTLPCLLSDFLTIITELIKQMPTLCTTPQMIGFVEFLHTQILECDQLHDSTDIINCVAQLKSDVRSVIEKQSRSSSSKRNKSKEDHKKPPEDFRTLSIVPKKDDVVYPVSFLRCNKVIGPYLDLDHYLDVQFRLYREDCVSPLRDALEEAIDKQKHDQKRFRLENGLIYRNIMIVHKETCVESGEVFTIELDSEHYKRINWEKSRRLIFGSLLLLSFDFFKTIFFAVVAESDRKSLQTRGYFKVQIYRSGNKNTSSIPKDRLGVMIEATSAYFEAYKHVLKALQNITPFYPFQKYLVYCETEVNPPNYINNDTIYDLGPVINGDRIQLKDIKFQHTSQTTNKQHQIKISKKEEWPTARELEMDESQRRAFIAALTKEFVLIQGPPGTGKTYIGLQIAKALLLNSIKWETLEVDDPTESPNLQNKPANDSVPLLHIVCYTNHALDQFVEGIINFIPKDSHRERYPKIVRFGSRCKNMKVEEFSIQNVRKRVRYGFRNHRHGVLERAMDIKKQMKKTKEMLEIAQNNSIVLNYTAIECVMSKQQLNSFGNENKNLAWFQWLHVTEQAWCKEVDKYYQSTPEVLIEQADVSELGNNQDSLVNVISEAEYAYNERYFEVDDLKSQVTFDDIGLDLNRHLQRIYENTPLLEPMCRQIYQNEKEKAERRIHLKHCMDEAVAEEVRNPWKLEIEDRWKLYRYWLCKFKALQQQQLKNHEKEFEEIFDEYTRESKEMDEEIMRNAAVIAMTTTAAARYNESLNKVGPIVTIVEEAAEVPEAHIVAAINHKCQHVILIGDHKQLEPKPAVYKLAKDYNLSVSLFERMVENKLSCQCLERQHRMRPEISTLVRHIYNVLEDNENVYKYEPIKGIKKNLFFITHDKKEKFKDEGRSFSNDYEAEYLKELCLYLLKQGYKGSDITIIAAYSGQMYCIREKMPRSAFGEVNICILDNYQGEENEIILLSLVRSNDKGVIGFLNRENRICVALSRARKGLYVIGNRSTLTLKSIHWRKIFQNIEEMDEKDNMNVKDNGEILRSHGKALPLYCQNHPMNDGILAASPADFKKAPDGGCEMKCEFRLDCGHVCEMRCHPVDREHKQYKCKKLCLKKCLEDHTCQKKCHFDKDCYCSKIMERKLECQHKVKLKCHENFLEHICTEQVSRTLTCGHEATMECHIVPSTYKCKVLVNRSLTCGHTATIQCHTDPHIYKCEVTITENRPVCGHDFTRKCFDVNYERKNKCNVAVVERRKTCSHKLERKCHDSDYENRQKCDIIISEIRSPCGHRYKRKCFDTAYERKNACKEVVEEQWSSCKHMYQRQCFDQSFCDRENCKIEIDKAFQNCGHGILLACHVDVSTKQCNKIIDTQLKCGHTIMHQCHERNNLVCHSKCNKICSNGHQCEKTCHFPNPCNCKTIIDVVLESCGHEQKVPCSCDQNNFRCKTIVSKPMTSCGHNQTMMCSEEPELMKCYVSVLKQFECGHKNAVACFSDITDIKCTKQTEVTLKSCGHKVEIECWQKDSADSHVTCKELVSFKRHNCDHFIDIKCFTRNTNQKLPLCEIPVEINMPCGHKSKLSCSKKSIKIECKNICGKKLFCGHPCPSLCQTCQTTKHHSECRKPCGKQLLCGHYCKSEKCLDCNACDEACSFSCPHSECGLKCSEPCQACTKKCSWQCPHFRCKKLCSEICDRPRCTKRCYKTLYCGHQCTGFCGEPCPESCLKCKPNMYNFPKLSKGTKTVTLSRCGHTFESYFIDDYIKRKKYDIQIKCPTCTMTVFYHPRYNASLKRNKALLENAKQQLHDTRTIPETTYPAPNVNFVQYVQGYVRSFATFLHISQHMQKSKELLAMIPFGSALVEDINKLLQNTDRWTFLRYLYILEMVQKIFLSWVECLLNSRPYTLSKTYTIPNNVDQAVDWFKKDKSEHNQKEKGIRLTGEQIIKRLQKITLERNKSKVMNIIQPLAGDFGRDVHFSNAIHYPEISPVVGIHRDDWTVCKKGHISPCVMDTSCVVCDRTQEVANNEAPLPHFIKTAPVSSTQLGDQKRLGRRGTLDIKEKGKTTPTSGKQAARERVRVPQAERQKRETGTKDKKSKTIMSLAEKDSQAEQHVVKDQKIQNRDKDAKQSTTKPSQSTAKDQTAPLPKETIKTDDKQLKQATKTMSKTRTGNQSFNDPRHYTHYNNDKRRENKKRRKEQDRDTSQRDETRYNAEQKLQHPKSRDEKSNNRAGQGHGRGYENGGRVKQFYGKGSGRGRGKQDYS